MKDFIDMSREELLDALDIIRLDRDIAWRIAAFLSKEKLIAEKRFLPRFVKANK